MIWLRNSMAASCSNLKRSRIELLASISRPTRSGRLVSLRKERIDLRRLAVVEHAEVVLLQVLDELAALVGNGEDHVDLVHPLDDGGELLVVSASSVFSWRAALPGGLAARQAATAVCSLERRARCPARGCCVGAGGGGCACWRLRGGRLRGILLADGAVGNVGRGLLAGSPARQAAARAR